MNNHSICIFTDEYPPDCGGVGVSVSRIARGLVDRGKQTTVIVLLDDCLTLPLTSNEGGIEVIRFGWQLSIPGATNTEQKAERFFRLVSFLEGRKFSLYHSFFPNRTGMEAGLIAKMRNRPFIASFRGNDLHHSIFNKNLLTVRWVLKSASGLSYANNGMKRMANALEKVSCPEILLRNGVARASEYVEPFRSSKVIFGTAGNLRTKKGISEILQAFQLLISTLDFLLLIIGDFRESEKEFWTDYIKQAGLDAKVDLTGILPHSEAVKRIGELDVYIHGSLYDGCPNALLEAASAARPIILANSMSSLPEFKDGEECLFYNPNSPQELAQAIEKLIDSPAFARRIGLNAKEKAVKIFNEDQEINDLLSLYSRVLA